MNYQKIMKNKSKSSRIISTFGAFFEIGSYHYHDQSIYINRMIGMRLARNHDTINTIKEEISNNVSAYAIALTTAKQDLNRQYVLDEMATFLEIMLRSCRMVIYLI
eukprot:TRINITY_DN2022_c0_g1_i1.p1 TRINITY_DN2022_c0_g1~~TRINITY_DN2022_c0_g1_i1.p1  ORF type:complete len:106 (-),score=0.98 TRINITY_DN2022_c0_g1_i1:30-347(-)